MNIRSKIFGSEPWVEPSPVVSAKTPRGAKADTLHSVSVTREVSRRGDTRRDDRHRLSEEDAHVTYKGSNFPVTLVNVSGGGAMIAADFEPMLWDRLNLHLGEDGVIECAVRWLKEGRIGLEFAHETRLDCSPDEQAVLLREVITRSFADIEFEAQPNPTEAEDDGSDHRRERRHPLIWSGTLHYDFTSAPVRLRNISSTGAQIEFEVPLPVGAEPLLDLGGAGSVFATVTWVVGDQAGLKFSAPFDLTQLANSRPEIAPTKWERPIYLETDSPSSPWADEWGRCSLSELREELEGFMKR